MQLEQYNRKEFLLYRWRMIMYIDKDYIKDTIYRRNRNQNELRKDTTYE